MIFPKITALTRVPWRRRVCRSPKGRELITPVAMRLQVQEQAFELELGKKAQDAQVESSKASLIK